MKYNIQIVSRHEAILIDTKDIKEDTIVISINCPNEQRHIFRNPKILDVLYLHCDDLTEEQFNKMKEDREEYILFNLNMAQEVKKFIDFHKDIKNITVHCTAGISRSGAVGVVISKYLNGQDIHLYNKGTISPNETVYKYMCEAFNIKFNKEELMNKKKISHKICQQQLKSYGDYGITIEDMFGGE